MGKGRSINLDPHKDRISRMIRGSTQQAIRDSLLRDYGLVISRAQFQRVLKAWGITSRHQNVQKTPELVAQVKDLISTYDITDKHTAELLEHAGWGHIPTSTVYGIRRGLGVIRQVSGSEQTVHQQGIREILMNEFNDGRIENMGRGLLYRHLRMQYGPNVVIGR